MSDKRLAEALEKHIHAISLAFAELSQETTFRELLKVIHNPDATLADLAYLSAMLQGLELHISAIKTLQNQINIRGGGSGGGGIWDGNPPWWDLVDSAPSWLDQLLGR